MYVFYPGEIAVIFAEKQFEKKNGHRQISIPCLTFCFNSSYCLKALKAYLV